MDLPPQPSVEFIRSCETYAANYYNLDPIVFAAVVRVEGGAPGDKNLNSNNTHDYGIAQFNSINIPDLQKEYPSVTEEELRNNPCINLMAGAWFLRKKINESGNVWKGVGNYHSKTPSLHFAYVTKVYKRYLDIFLERLKAN